MGRWPVLGSMAFRVPQAFPQRRTSAGSAPAAIACAKPATVESPDPVAFTQSMRGGTARKISPSWKAADPAAPMDTTTQATPLKRPSASIAFLMPNTSSLESSRPSSALSSLRLGFTR